MNNTGKYQLDWFVKNYFTSTFTRIFVVLAIGIILAEYSSIPQNIFLWIAVCGLMLMIISTFNKKNCWKWIFVFALDIFLLCIGGVLLESRRVPVLKVDKDTVSVIRLTSAPILKNNFFKADAELLYLSDTLISTDKYGKILCYFYADSTANIPQNGNTYTIRSKISLKSNSGVPQDFDYGQYLNRHGYCGMTYIFPQDYALIKEGEPHGLMTKIENFRSCLIDRYRVIGLDDDELSLLTAITLGEKGLLTKETKDNFSAAGVSHILVVSGMHVGFIFAVIMLLLSIAGRFKVIVALFGLIILWGYALLTGFAPSVIRATFMFSLMLLFRISGRRYRSYHALSLSAVILLFYNPFIIFDVGFQLSYTAVLSIIFFYSKFMSVFKGLHKKHRHIYRFIQPVMISISAQILTFPIVLFHFNQFPIYFVITNLILSFVAPIIFCFGMMMLPLSFVPYINDWGGWLINRILTYFNDFVAFMANLPFSVTKGYISLIECSLIFIVILFVSNLMIKWKFVKYRFKAMVFLGSSLLILFSTILIGDIIDSKREYCIVSDSYKLNINLFGHGNNILFTNQSSAPEIFEPLWLKYHCDTPKIINDTALIDNCFVFNDETYLILRDNIFRYRKNSGSPLKVNYLIIDRGVYPSERLLTEFINPQTVILTNVVWQGYLPKYRTLTDSLGIEYYSIAESGAYCIKR